MAVLKKHYKSAAEVQTFVLPREDSPVPLDYQVELTSGHELVFLPLMPDPNNAATTRIDDLALKPTL